MIYGSIEDRMKAMQNAVMSSGLPSFLFSEACLSSLIANGFITETKTIESGDDTIGIFSATEEGRTAFARGTV